MIDTRAKGSVGEDLAAEYLLRQGFTIIERNFHFQHGEIDIIAKELSELVFVEVKYRTTKAFGLPEESVDEKKQELLRRTAEGYMQQRGLHNIECRFDVVAILRQETSHAITHYRNAF